MKKYLLLCFSFCITLATIAAPWDLKPKILPDVLYSSAFVWNAAYTPSGQREIGIVINLDDYTGNYTSRVTVSIYGNYRKTQLGWPQVYWEWGYKEFTVDIPPNSHDGFQSYILHTGEAFNMSGVGTANGQGEGLESGQVTLVSYIQI